MCNHASLQFTALSIITRIGNQPLCCRDKASRLPKAFSTVPYSVLYFDPGLSVPTGAPQHSSFQTLSGPVEAICCERKRVLNSETQLEASQNLFHIKSHMDVQCIKKPGESTGRAVMEPLISPHSSSRQLSGDVEEKA